MNATLLVSSTAAASRLPSGEMYTPSGDSPRSIFFATARFSRSITRSALLGWSDTYASLRAAWIAAPRGLPPVLISPATSSRAVSISVIVPAFSLPTSARPASAVVGTSARARSRRLRLFVIVISDCPGLEDGDVAHHHPVLVLQVVAVEHVALRAAERCLLRQGKVEREPQRLVRPREHGVLDSEVGGEASARFGGEPACRAEGAQPAQHAKAEPVNVHGVRHGDGAVLDLPHLARSAAHAEPGLVDRVRRLVDEEARALVEVEPHAPRRRVRRRGGFRKCGETRRKRRDARGCALDPDREEVDLRSVSRTIAQLRDVFANRFGRER